MNLSYLRIDSYLSRVIGTFLISVPRMLVGAHVYADILIFQQYFNFKPLFVFQINASIIPMALYLLG